MNQCMTRARDCLRERFQSVKAGLLAVARWIRIHFPSWQVIFFVSSLATGLIFRVPIFGSLTAIGLTCIVALLVTRIDGRISEYFFRTFFLIFWTVALFNYFMQINFGEYPIEKEYSTVMVKWLKTFSLIMLMLDAFSGANFASNQESNDQNALSIAKFAAGSCIPCAVILIISMFPNAKAAMQDVSTIFGCSKIGELNFAVVINFIAIFPIYMFLLNNLLIVNKNGNDDGYVKKLCADYLWLINVPAVICSVSLVILSYFMRSFGVEIKEIEGVLSGGICFLVFSAIMISIHIEHEHRSNMKAASTIQAKPGP